MYLPLYKIADTHFLIQSDKITKKNHDCCRGLDYAVNCYCKYIWRQNASLWDGYLPLANLVRCKCYLIWLYAFYIKKLFVAFCGSKHWRIHVSSLTKNWTNVGSMLSQRRNLTGPGNMIRGTWWWYRLHASKRANILRATDYQVLNNKIILVFPDIKVIFSFHPLANLNSFSGLGL